MASDIYAFSDADRPGDVLRERRIRGHPGGRLSVSSTNGAGPIDEAGLPVRLGARDPCPERSPATTCSTRSSKSRRPSRGSCSPWRHEQKKPFDASRRAHPEVEEGHLRRLRDVLPRLAPGRLLPPSGRGRMPDAHRVGIPALRQRRPGHPHHRPQPERRDHGRHRRPEIRRGRRAAGSSPSSTSPIPRSRG